jgi:hypothetical protein
MSQGLRTYDQEYIEGLRRVADSIPQNETITAAEVYPQVTYFTDHKVKAPWVTSERALVQFMWKNNSTYLLAPEYTSTSPPDNTPLLIQMARKPFEMIYDFYAQYISVPKPEPVQENKTANPLLNASSLLSQQLDNNTLLNIRKSIEKNVVFPKLFEKISDYPTENSLLHLYHLRSNITRDNLIMVTDITRPLLSVSVPVNRTIMESEFDVLHVNVTGSAEDVDSNIKKVEISIAGSPFQLATPRAPNDWSTWSFSDFATAGTKRIVVRATDNADNIMRVPLYITIK